MTIPTKLAAAAALLIVCASACQRDSAASERDKDRRDRSERSERADRGEERAEEHASPAAESQRDGGDRPSGTAPASPGSAQRAALMDALRPSIEQELGTRVEFVVQRAAVRDGWALVIADPQRPGGGEITPPDDFDMEFRDGLTVNAILRFSGGGWTLVDHAIGPTDVWYCGVDGPPAALTGC